MLMTMLFALEMKFKKFNGYFVIKTNREVLTLLCFVVNHSGGG